MKMRRVVTGHSSDGKAIVASDTEVETVRVDLLPGVEYRQIWSVDAPPTYPDEQAAAAALCDPCSGYTIPHRGGLGNGRVP